MAEATERRKRTKRKPRREHDEAAEPRKKKSQPKAQPKPKPKREPREENAVKGMTLSVTDILGRILPVLSLALAFTAIVLLYRRIMPRAVQTDTSENVAAPEVQSAVSNSVQNDYAGLEDPWNSTGVFTTGNSDLDLQVKAFCDALCVEGGTASSNAQNAYNTIVWSEVEDRSESQKPNGDEWTIVSAKHYFSGGSPEDGIGGVGDEYEFAAAISYCLQYFGYDDALAIPIYRGSASAGQTSGALVIVTDENGRDCVCDPALAGNGWMVARSEYDILVENIGQDLKKMESRGLTVQKDDPKNSSTSANSGGSDEVSGRSSHRVSDSSESTSSSSDEYSAYDDYGTVDEYGYDYI